MLNKWPDEPPSFPLLHLVNLGPGMLIIHPAALGWGQAAGPGLPVSHRSSLGVRGGGLGSAAAPPCGLRCQGACGTDLGLPSGSRGTPGRAGGVPEALTENTEGEEMFLKSGPGAGVREGLSKTR